MSSIAARGLLAVIAWWIISEGQLSSATVGLPAVIAAVALSLALAPPSRLNVRPSAVPPFIVYFLFHSCRAGIDVSRRILHPRMPVRPFISRVPLSLPRDGSRLLLTYTLNLMPGTLAVQLEDEYLVLHQLNRHDEIDSQVHALEVRIARLYGFDLREAA